MRGRSTESRSMRFVQDDGPQKIVTPCQREEFEMLAHGAMVVAERKHRALDPPLANETHSLGITTVRASR
jgi:hypothetical protein